jgi:hypothetical protein
MTELHTPQERIGCISRRETAGMSAENEQCLPQIRRGLTLSEVLNKPGSTGGIQMRSIYIVIALAWGLNAYAVVLPEIPAAPSDRLPIDTAEPSVPCDQIIDRLTTYNDMAREHDTSITGFLGEVTSKLSDWHALLLPLEGKQTTIEPGTFSPLLKGSEEISNITNRAYDNSDLLRQEMEKLINSLRDCGVGAASVAH